MEKAKKKIEKKVAKKEIKTSKKTVIPKEDTGNFAVIETGGKQYLVRKGDKIKIEKIEKPVKGNEVVFDKVLLVVKGEEFTLGQPYVKTAKVKAEWIAEKRQKKLPTSGINQKQGEPAKRVIGRYIPRFSSLNK